MKLLQCTYSDELGNIWEIEKIYLTNKRGTLIPYWNAECQNFNWGTHGKTKKEIMKNIKEHLEMRKKTPEKICCLCGEKFEGYGNNPAPLGDNSESSRCCDLCNNEKVIPARISQLFQNHKN